MTSSDVLEVTLTIHLELINYLLEMFNLLLPLPALRLIIIIY